MGNLILQVKKSFLQNEGDVDRDGVNYERILNTSAENKIIHPSLHLF